MVPVPFRDGRSGGNMRRRPASFLALVALVGGLLATSPVASLAAAAPEPDRLDVYVGELTAQQIS